MGIANAPSLVHTPGAMQLQRRGGKRRRRWAGRAGLFAKDLGVNSVHAVSHLKLVPRKKKLTIAYRQDVEKSTSKADRAAIKTVMDRWKAGKLHSGHPRGPIVGGQKQAIAIALSEINKALFQKANPYHDDKGRFTSADGATGGDGGAARQSYERYRATGEAIGGVAGTYGGQAAGAALGSFAGPIGTGVGRYAGGFAGGLAGDYVGRRIAQALYATAHPSAKEAPPEHSLAEEFGGAAGGLTGYVAGGTLAARAIPDLQPAEAVARVLGQTAGDISGTRFGNYVSQRVGGVLASTRSALGARYSFDAATDAGADALTVAKAKVTVSAFPKIPQSRRNDPNDSAALAEIPAHTRFRALMAARETAQRGKAVRLQAFAPKMGAWQPNQYDESFAEAHQQFLRQALPKRGTPLFGRSPT